MNWKRVWLIAFAVTFAAIFLVNAYMHPASWLAMAAAVLAGPSAVAAALWLEARRR